MWNGNRRPNHRPGNNMGQVQGICATTGSNSTNNMELYAARRWKATGPTTIWNNMEQQYKQYGTTWNNSTNIMEQYGWDQCK